MSDNQQQNSTVTFFGALFTVIAVVALIGLVMVRSRAQTAVEQVNQQTASAPAPIEFVDQSLTQMQGGNLVDVGGLEYATPTHSIILTPGALSVPVNYTMHFIEPNGVSNTLLKENAGVILDADFVETGSSDSWCSPAQDSQGNDVYNGATCWTEGFGSWAPVGGPQISDVVSIDPGDGTHGTMNLSFRLPYFAAPGKWIVRVTMYPVDASGNLSNEMLFSQYCTNPMTCFVGNHQTIITAIRAMVDPLLAIDVAPTLNTTPGTLVYKLNGGPMTPGSDSDTANNAGNVTVTQKGNIEAFINLYGTEWASNEGNGQTMPVDTTHFASHLANFSYTNPLAQALDVSTNQTQVQDFSQLRPTSMPVRWAVGGMDGNLITDPVILDQFYPGMTSQINTNDYSTVIHVKKGVTGSFSSLLTNIGVDAGVGGIQNMSVGGGTP
jgi:hypothetical protein